MAIMDYTVEIPLRTVRSIMPRLKALRPPKGYGKEWRDYMIVANGQLIGGNPLECIASVSIGSPLDVPAFAVSYDALTAACKGAKGSVTLSPGAVETSVGTFRWDVFREADGDAALSVPSAVSIYDDGASPLAAWTADTFASAVAVTVPFASRDESRPVLTGVCITGDGEWGATDSYRLIAIRPESMSDAECDMIVPAKVLATVAKLNGTGQVTACAMHETSAVRRATFTGDGFQVTTRLIDGQYPNFHALMPEGQVTWVNLADGERGRAIAYCKAQASGSTLTVQTTAEGVEITGDQSSMHLPCAVAAREHMTIGLNAHMLADCLSATPNGGATIGLISPLRPILVTAAEGSEDMLNVRCIQMPVRIA